MQVLVVNDSPLILMAIRSLLGSEGYEVLSASNGQEALNILEQGTCQIVILDWEMPIMDGVEFCRIVRECFFARYIYIIFLTSHQERQWELDGLEAGADDYIFKSNDSSPLLLARLKIAKRILSEEACGLVTEAIRLINQAKPDRFVDHGPRVAACCFEMLKELEKKKKFQDTIDSTFRRHFHAVCSLYDIGYIGLPDDLQIVRRGLSDQEYEVYKKHTSIGSQIFERLSRDFPAADFLAMARDMAATHHERYDGSGYPVGLKGESIPLVGRILFLADTYDALISSDRSVEPMSHDYAKWLISQGKKIHFDPDVVDAFLTCEDQFQEQTLSGILHKDTIKIDLE